MIIVPDIKYEDITGDERILMRAIIRTYAKPLFKDIGADMAEEVMINLFNHGIIKFFEEERNGENGIALKLYDTIKKEYCAPGDVELEGIIDLIPLIDL